MSYPGSFQLELEYADDDARVSDAWLMFAPTPHLRAQFRNFKEPFTLEAVTSSRHLTFMERSLVDGFAPPRHIGAALRTNFAPATAAIGLFGQAPGDIGEEGLEDSEAWGAGARATVRYNNYVRFTANYLIVNNDALADANGTAEGDDDFRALLFRVAYFF